MLCQRCEELPVQSVKISEHNTKGVEDSTEMRKRKGHSQYPSTHFVPIITGVLKHCTSHGQVAQAFLTVVRVVIVGGRGMSSM